MRLCSSLQAPAHLRTRPRSTDLCSTGSQRARRRNLRSCCSRGNESARGVSTVVLEAHTNGSAPESNGIDASHNSATDEENGHTSHRDSADVSREPVQSHVTGRVPDALETASTSGGISVAYGLHRSLPAQVRIHEVARMLIVFRICAVVLVRGAQCCD